MPSRRKNVDLNRAKRSSKRSRLGDILSSSYVQYLFIFIIWGILLLINQSTEMRFEYFWPSWLFICSIHDSMKYQGLQYTIVFIIIVITVDLICFFLIPASWIYSCGSAYVWVYLLWHTDQGLCFLTLIFCFVFVYFELGFYSRDAKLSQSIYLFRPFAAHSIGYPVVCMGFSIKRYLDVRHRKFKKLDVRRQNSLYFRILREALPFSAVTSGSGLAYPSVYLPDDIPEPMDSNTNSFDSDPSGNPLPWSVFLLQQLGKSVCTKICHWTSPRPLLSDREYSSHATSAALSNGTVSGPLNAIDTSVKRVTTGAHDNSSSLSNVNNTRRHPVDGQHTSETHAKGKQLTSNKHGSGRAAREDPTTRLENNVRRLRTEVQSMRAVKSQLLNQLTHLERQDRLNRLCLSDQKEKHETLVSELSKLAAQCRSEKSNLTTIEHNLSDEKRLRQSLEEQIAEETSGEEIRSSPPGSPSSPDESQSAGDGQSVSTGGLAPGIALVTESSCCQRRHSLESEVYTKRVALRQLDEQIRNLSGPKSRQHQQQSSRVSSVFASKHSATSLGMDDQRSNRRHKIGNIGDDTPDLQTLDRCLQKAKAEAERLTVKLRQQNWIKQELLTSYHNSVRDINELSKTHKQRDLQILELTMKAEQLECLSLSKTAAALDKVRSTGFKRDVGQLGTIGEKLQTKMSSVVSTTFPTTVRSSSHLWNSDGEFLPGYVSAVNPPQDPSTIGQPLTAASTNSYSGFLHPDKCAGSYELSTSSFACPRNLLASTTIGSDVAGPNRIEQCPSSSHFTETSGCSDILLTSHPRQSGFGSIQRLSTETH